MSLVETKPQTARQWAKRRKAAVKRVTEMGEKLTKNHVPGNAREVYDNAVRMLFQALMQEGRITEDEATARLCEYQLLYYDALWANHVRAVTSREAALGPDASRDAQKIAGSVGMAGRGSVARANTARVGGYVPDARKGQRLPHRPIPVKREAELVEPAEPAA